MKKRHSIAVVVLLGSPLFGMNESERLTSKRSLKAKKELQETTLHGAVNGHWVPWQTIPDIKELTDMRNLMENGASIECVKNGQTPLQLSLEKCRLKQMARIDFGYERVLALLACGAKISEAEFNEFLPNVLPINYGIILNKHGRESRFLGACTEAAVKGTLLEPSNKLGLETTFEQILEHKNAQDPILHMTGAMWAAARGNLSLLEQLYELGCDFMLQDHCGYNVLHFAVLNKHLEIARFILQKQWKTSIAKNNNGKNPIDLAISLKRSHEFLTVVQDELHKVKC